MTAPIIVVAGPTASGKSALALALAEDLARAGAGAVLVNADSMQVYRELEILTARPSAAELARAPHRLYGFAPAAEAFSVGRWRALALAELRAARAAGRAALVVGGSGLYVSALTDGLAPVPPVAPEVLRRAAARRAELGARAFHAELAARDPDSRRLAPGDAQRTVRAWAVLESSGRALADWRAEPRDPLPGPILRILLRPERSALYRACDRRFAAMLARGVLEEARALAALDLDPALPAMKALGVRPLLDCLTGAVTLEEAAARAARDTRRYAKRQLTWLRRRYPADLVLDGAGGAAGPDARRAALSAILASTGASR